MRAREPPPGRSDAAWDALPASGVLRARLFDRPRLLGRLTDVIELEGAIIGDLGVVSRNAGLVERSLDLRGRDDAHLRSVAEVVDRLPGVDILSAGRAPEGPDRSPAIDLAEEPSGTVCVFHVRLPDVPGSLGRLAAGLAGSNLGALEVTGRSEGKVERRVEIRCRDASHRELLINALRSIPDFEVLAVADDPSRDGPADKIPDGTAGPTGRH